MLLDQECGLMAGTTLYFWRTEGPRPCFSTASGAHDDAESSDTLPAGIALLYFLAKRHKICHLHCCILCFDSSSSFNGICQNVGHSKAEKQNQWREKLPAPSNSSAVVSYCCFKTAVLLKVSAVCFRICAELYIFVPKIRFL